MAWIWMRSVFVLILLVNVKCVLGEIANLGDSVKLTASENCTDGEILTLIRRLKDDSSRTVATLVNGVWTPEEVYKDRIEHNSSFSVNLTRVNYNDNGLYEFTCGRRFGRPIQLKVVIPFDISVTQGETVKLPCHFFTAGEPAKPVRWEKDEELVIELDPSSRGIRYGTGFEGRASVSSDWYLTGDLSLTFEGVQPEDQGDYICYVQDKEGKRTRGNPAAVRVNERTPDQITCTPPPDREMKICISVGIIVLVILALPVCVWLVRWLKSRRSNVSSGPGGGRPSTDVEMGLVTERDPASSQVNGGPSRVDFYITDEGQEM